MDPSPLREHFRRPHGAGVLDDADAVGRAQNPACGDVLELSLRMSGDAIAEARFRAQGCVAVIACASQLTDLVRGLPAARACRLTAGELAHSLGGLPEASAHAAALAVEALRAALRSVGGGR